MIISGYGRNAFDSLMGSAHSLVALDCTQEVFDKIIKKYPDIKIKPKIRMMTWFDQRLKHQGLRFEAEMYIHRDLSDLDYENMKTILVLDHVQDPQNVGSCLRHATAFGVDAVLLPLNQSAPLTEAVVQSSSGGLFLVPVIQAPSFGQILDRLSKAGFGLIGTSLSDRTEEFSTHLFWPKTAIIVGNEGAGLSAGVEKKCDHLVKIPINACMQSLNVAVTAAILCYERAQQLRKIL